MPTPAPPPTDARPPADSRRTEDRFVPRALQFGNRLLGRVYHRTIVRAPLQLPRRGPAILVCNHISGLDPLLLQSVCPRLVVWMMAKEYYEIRPLRWVFESVGAIPVERSGRDMAATRAAFRALENGAVLGIFPEGKIALTRDLLPFQTGVSLMAIKADVPIYPAFLEGTQRGLEMRDAILTPQKASITFGPPIHFPRGSGKRPNLDAATDQIRRAVEALRPPADEHPG